MWIEIQDKSDIIDVTNKRIFVSNDIIFSSNKLRNKVYIDLMKDASYVTAGLYETEQRAMEVYDEIKKLLTQESVKCYEMPQK